MSHLPYPRMHARFTFLMSLPCYLRFNDPGARMELSYFGAFEEMKLQIYQIIQCFGARQLRSAPSYCFPWSMEQKSYLRSAKPQAARFGSLFRVYVVLGSQKSRNLLPLLLRLFGPLDSTFNALSVGVLSSGCGSQ